MSPSEPLVPTCPDPPNFQQEVLKRTILIVVTAYAAWFMMYFIFGAGFLVVAGCWLVGTIGYFVWVKVTAGAPVPKAVIQSTMQMVITGPLIAIVVNSVGAFQFLAISAPITILSGPLSYIMQASFIRVWLSLYALAVVASFFSRPAKIYDMEEAKKRVENGVGTKTVAVVGGGMSGIVTAKECVQNGLDVVMYEKSSHVGGVWASGGQSKRAWGTILSTSSTLNTQFSDFPMEPYQCSHRTEPSKVRYPDHFTRDEYMDYLDGYAQHFGVDKVSRLNTSVTSIRPSTSGKKGYMVTVQSEDGSTSERHFDFIAVCSGLAHLRKEILLKGQDKFVKSNGDSAVTHSEFFDGPEPYKGKTTVVVGAGETASDICADLAAAGNTVHMIQRSPTLWLARLMPDLPPDYQEQFFLFMLPRFFRVLRFSLPPYAGWLMSKVFTMQKSDVDTSMSAGFWEMHIKNATFHPRSKGWATSLTLGKQLQVTKAAMLSEYIGKNCQIWPYDVKECTADGVVLSDPESTHIPCERIIMAYGFQQKYPFLPKEFHLTNNHDRYYYVFHPELPNIGWVGTVRGGIGSIPMGAEMQARWFALAAAGKRPLPSQADMKTWVCNHKAKWAARGHARWVTEVTTVYAKYLARHFVHCEPNLWEIFFRDPKAWFKVLASTMCTSMFRFTGPHSTPDISYKMYRDAKCEMQLGYIFCVGTLSLVSYPLWLCLRFFPQGLVEDWLPAFEGYF